MRVLMLAQFYPPIMGGEERHVKSLVDELASRGHQVSVATLLHPGMSAREQDGLVSVHRIRSTTGRVSALFSEAERQHAPSFPDPETVAGLRRVMEEEKPDIVHAHNWILHSYLPLKSRYRAPLVVTLHEYSRICVKKRLMYKGEPCSGPGLLKCLGCASSHYGRLKGPVTYFGKMAISPMEDHRVDMYLAVSEATAAGNRIAKFKTPYRIIPNFVPDKTIEDQKSFSSSLTDQLPPDGYLLFVGDLSRDKGIHILLEAYADMQDVPPLVLIGRKTVDTPEKLPANVFMFNSWPHDAILEAWRRSSIALAPSFWPEPFGIVVIEAMASGKPVVGSRIGGIPDIVVDGESGLLVPPGDVGALQKAIECLVRDPGLRRRMGEAARERVRLFRASVVVPQIEKVYHDLAEARLATGEMGRKRLTSG